MEYESVGQKLKSTRVEKKISVEQISRDTFISIRLIRALEDEHDEEFSSEVYLVGFLKTYAAYLGLDSNEIVRHFRSMHMQEQPTPITELLQKKSSTKKLALIITLIVVTVAGLVFLVGQPFFSTIGGGAGFSRATVESGTVYSLEDDFLERQFQQGEKIGISTDGQFQLIEVKKIGRFVTLQTKDERFTLQNNERLDIPLDPEGNERAEITVRNIIRDREQPAATLQIVIRSDGDQDTNAEQDQAIDNGYGNTVIASRRRAPTDLGQYDASTTFPIQISFTAPAFLQYQVDSAQRISRIYSAQDVVALNPRQKLLVWVTNAGAVNLNVADRFVPIGKSGEVSSFVIEKRSSSLLNKDTLRIVPLY